MITILLKCFSVVLGFAISTTAIAGEPSIASRPFGEFEGRPVSLFTLTNQHGMSHCVVPLRLTAVLLL